MLGPVRQLLGLDALRVAVTAAAPIPVEILQFFRSLGLPLSEMYGLSESSGRPHGSPSACASAPSGTRFPASSSVSVTTAR